MVTTSMTPNTFPMTPCTIILVCMLCFLYPIPHKAWVTNTLLHRTYVTIQSRPTMILHPREQVSTPSRPTGSQLQQGRETPSSCLWESFNALTLVTRNMSESVAFYEKLGLTRTMGGGPNDVFTTLSPHGDYTERECMYINLFYDETYEPPPPSGQDSSHRNWGRCVIHVSDVDTMYQLAIKGGLTPEFPPRDAPWGERYFHLCDPMGHELSFAKRINDHPRWKEM